jgi:hypothetical protein
MRELLRKLGIPEPEPQATFIQFHCKSCGFIAISSGKTQYNKIISGLSAGVSDCSEHFRQYNGVRVGYSSDTSHNVFRINIAETPLNDTGIVISPRSLTILNRIGMHVFH